MSGAHFFVLGILFIIFGSVFGSIMFSRYIKFKEKMLKRQHDMDSEYLSMALEKQKQINGEFEKRIQALESIVISENYELKEKFKNL